MNIAFGPVPSRRLGRSLGINNIPPKSCSYSCLYCQEGATQGQKTEPQEFYTPDHIYRQVRAQLEKADSVNEPVDYLTFVPDAEPTLDIKLGETIEQNTAMVISSTVLGGIVLFFLLEKIVIWRHCHETKCEVNGTAGPPILIGDAFHNFFVIAAAFSSVPLGVAASLAVIAHEIPQELGNFAILLNDGYSTTRALLLNLLSSLTTLPGAVIAYHYLGITMEALPFILALSAASFIYIAIADLARISQRRGANAK